MVPLFLGPLGIPELVMILVILILLFGANKIPLIGKGLGEGIRNFKKGLKGDEKDRAESNEQIKP